MERWAFIGPFNPPLNLRDNLRLIRLFGQSLALVGQTILVG